MFHIIPQEKKTYWCGLCCTDSPLLKSAIQSGLSTRPSPGLHGEIGGENEAVLLLQSSSRSIEGSKSGVSSSSIPKSLNGKHAERDEFRDTHPKKYVGKAVPNLFG